MDVAALSLDHLVRLTLLPLILFIYLFIYLGGIPRPPLANILPEPSGRMKDEVATITLDVLSNVWTETE
jgi:hypothetical protein